MTSTTLRRPTTTTGTGRVKPPFFRNPWRRAWFLEGFTWLYLIWSLLPIAVAVLFSFNNGRSQSVWQGFSLRWYYQDPVNSVLHNPDLHAAVIGRVAEGAEIAVASAGRYASIRRFDAAPLMGFGA